MGCTAKVAYTLVHKCMCFFFVFVCFVLFCFSHYLFEFSMFILFSIFLTIYNIKYYCKYILINYFQPRKQIKKYKKKMDQFHNLLCCNLYSIAFGEGTFSEWLKWLTQIFWMHNYLMIYLFIYLLYKTIYWEVKLWYLFNE